MCFTSLSHDRSGVDTAIRRLGGGGVTIPQSPLQNSNYPNEVPFSTDKIIIIIKRATRAMPRAPLIYIYKNTDYLTEDCKINNYVATGGKWSMSLSEDAGLP